MQFDYSNLLGLMRQKRFTQAKMASKIGINVATVSLKLCGKVGFKQDEISKISSLLSIPREEIGLYFFYPKT